MRHSVIDTLIEWAMREQSYSAKSDIIFYDGGYHNKDGTDQPRWSQLLMTTAHLRSLCCTTSPVVTILNESDNQCNLYCCIFIQRQVVANMNACEGAGGFIQLIKIGSCRTDTWHIVFNCTLLQRSGVAIQAKNGTIHTVLHTRSQYD